MGMGVFTLVVDTLTVLQLCCSYTFDTQSGCYLQVREFKRTIGHAFWKGHSSDFNNSTGTGRKKISTAKYQTGVFLYVL